MWVCLGGHGERDYWDRVLMFGGLGGDQRKRRSRKGSRWDSEVRTEKREGVIKRVKEDIEKRVLT